MHKPIISPRAENAEVLRILSVNVGGIRQLTLPDKEATTGFYKLPSSGPVRVLSNGLEGDHRVTFAADLDRAVLFYPVSDYAFWQAQLGKFLPHGTLGENVTFDALGDGKFFLGDVLRIGEATFRITQPRFPCRKLNARMGEGQDFARRFLESGRLGFFCRVIEGGVLSAGQAAELVHREDNPVSLGEFTRVTYLEPRDGEGVRRLLAAPALGSKWRAKLEKKLQRLELSSEGEWHGYRPLIVTRRQIESADVVSFELDDKSGNALPPHDAGQFLTLKFDVSGREIVRTYTIVSRSENGRGYAIAVKREAGAGGVPAGIGSTHLHEHLVEGSSVLALPPRGQFVLKLGDRPVVLLSAGIGVTPMVAMLQQLAVCSRKRPVLFAHGARCGSEHALDAQVQSAISRAPYLKRFVKYSSPQTADARGVHFDEPGRLTVSDVERLMGSLDADFYICGPVAFMRDIVKDLSDCGVGRDRINYEFFGADGDLFADSKQVQGDSVSATGDSQILVTFAKSGISVPWTTDVVSLLSLAEKNGLRPEASCRTGLCNSCVSRLDEGEVAYSTEPLDYPDEGEILLCCTRPITNVVIDA